MIAFVRGQVAAVTLSSAKVLKGASMLAKESGAL